MTFSPTTEHKIRVRMHLDADSPIDDTVIERMQYQGMIVTDDGSLNVTQAAMVRDYLGMSADEPVDSESLLLLEKAEVLIRGI